MDKHLILPYAGFDYRIPLNKIVSIVPDAFTGATELHIIYSDIELDTLTPANSGLKSIVITHVADPTPNEFKEWFIGEMKAVLATRSNVTSLGPISSPPHVAITTINWDTL